MRYLLPLFLLLLAGCASPRQQAPLPNSGYVGNDVRRNGQPTAKGFCQLQAAGFTNVIKLNTWREGDERPAESLGMHVTYIPIGWWRQVFGPVKADLDRAAESITPGTDVHCIHGSDRTGAVIYRYMLSHDYSVEEADAELADTTFIRRCWLSAVMSKLHGERR